MSEAKVSWQPSSTLEIRYTGNIHGDLETLPYTATVIKNSRREYPDMLLFDTGSFSGPNSPGNIQGDPHIKVYNHLKYDAAVPGRAEAMDTKALKRMARGASFPFIATNWRGMGEGDFFENRKVIKRENDIIVVLGMACTYTPQDTELIDAEKAMDEALKDFDPAEATVVILSQLDGNQNLSLAKHGKFTKVIISGIPVPGLDQTMQIGNSLIVPASEGPKTLGSVSVSLSGAVKMPKKQN